MVIQKPFDWLSGLLVSREGDELSVVSQECLISSLSLYRMVSVHSMLPLRMEKLR